jgi:hypothetical protein
MTLSTTVRSFCTPPLIVYQHITVHRTNAYQNTNTAIWSHWSVGLLRLSKIGVEIHVWHIWILPVLCIGVRIEPIAIIIR